MLIRRMPFLFLLGILFFGLSGCASMRASSAERAHRERAVKAYLHASPSDVLMSNARKILFEQGFEVNDSTDSTLQTAWILDGTSETRYLVTITNVNNRKRVEMTQNVVSEANHRTTYRDWIMEYELIKRVAPRDAAKIDADATAAGQAAAVR